MTEEFERLDITIPLGSIMKITWEHLDSYNRNRMINMRAYLYDEPTLPSNYTDINFLLVGYENTLSLSSNSSEPAYNHYYELLHDETLYEVSFRIIGDKFHPDNFLEVIKRAKDN